MGSMRSKKRPALKWDLDTEKQVRFVEEYLIDLNATQAAIRAGYSEKTATVCGAQNLTKPNISKAIEEALASRSDRTNAEADRVVLELVRLAYSRLTDAVKWNKKGITLHDSENLPDDVKAAISEVKETRSPNGAITITVKFHSKPKALELLARHLGMLIDRRELTTPPGKPIEIKQTGLSAEVADDIRKLILGVPE